MPGPDLTRRAITLAGLAGLTAPSVVRAQATSSFTSTDQRRGLPTVRVMINELGPYAFAIDSAANASVIADDLAVSLALPDSGDVMMHTVVAHERASTVRAARLRTGALDVDDTRLVVTGRPGLLGLDGLLGTDLLADLRLVLNFRGRGRASITRSRRHTAAFDGIRLTALEPATGQQRFNGLLLVNARSGVIPCKVIVDTGAKLTIINTSLARRAGAQPLILPDGSSVGRILSPTGRGAVGEAMLLPDLQLGGARLTRIPVLVGDFHTFAVWELIDEPAMLLGVDLLGLFETVIIDLKQGELLLDR